MTVVEDTATGRIVSTLFLIPQVWSYAGVPMKVGQPELIATHPDYRRRGLVRAQFDVVHEWSRAAGHLWQFISGIPGTTASSATRTRSICHPARCSGSARRRRRRRPSSRSARRRPPTSGSSPRSRPRRRAARRSVRLRGPDGFALELARRPGSLLACEVLVIEPSTARAAPIGYVAHQRRLVDGVVSVRAFELRRGDNWLGAHGGRRGPPPRLGPCPPRRPRPRCPLRPAGRTPGAALCRDPARRGTARVVRAVRPGPRRRRLPPRRRPRARSAPGRFTGCRLDGRAPHRPLHGRTSAPLRRGTASRRSSAGARRPTTPTSAADASLPVDDFLHLLLGNRRIVDLERTTADCLLESDAGALLLDVLFPPMPMSTWEFC